jgi:DNA-nicking Smr family endonuclease
MNEQNADQAMTEIMIRCRNHDVKQISEMTGATKQESEIALSNHGNKWLACESLKKLGVN